VWKYDGTPTGLHPEHRLLAGLTGFVAARTSPSLAVTVEAVEIDGQPLARILLPKARGEVATSGGVYLRRRLKPDGTPECAPMLPHDRISRAARFGLIDVSAQPVAGATLADLDPLERERLRQAVQQYGGERVLLELDDEAMDGALGLTAREADGSRIPTLAGLLLVGRETALRQLVPTHEFAFQVMKQQAVRLTSSAAFPCSRRWSGCKPTSAPTTRKTRFRSACFGCRCRWWTWAPSAKPWPTP
jgi:ATP-dependent DNA helicase RecG